jgi:hypothetical protein
MTKATNAVKAVELNATINTIVSKLDELSAVRDTWEKTEYRTATESLYLLLSRTYAVYEDFFVKADDKDRLVMRKELVSKLLAANIRTTKSSSTLSLLIRCVFKSDRQRVMRYRYVVEAAKSHKISASNLASWLREQGGIDAVMKAAAIKPETVAAKAALQTETEAVRNQLDERKHEPLATIEIENIKASARSVLIAEAAIDGSFKIVEVVSDISDALYNQLIQLAARSKLKEKAEIAETQSEAKMFSSKSVDQIEQQIAA